MNIFAPALVQVFVLLSSLTVVAAVLVFLVRPPRWYLRSLFVVGLLVLPIAFFALTEIRLLSATYAFVIALVGLFGIIGAFAALGVRQSARDGAHSSVGADVLLYLFSSVLWSALIYWSGAAEGVEGFHFELAQLGGGPQPHCLQAPELICNHLTPWEALHYSVGNLLTLGAPGITPLDEITRAFTLLQLVPVFLAAYVYVRR